MAVNDEGYLASESTCITQFTDPKSEHSFSVSYALSSENICDNVRE